MKYNIVQTFFIDPSSVNGADLIYLTDVELFFRHVPNANNNASGNPAPGINIQLCATAGNNLPDITQLIGDSDVRLEYTQINTSLDSNTATFCSFNQPVPVKTGIFYGVAIHYDSPEFLLWYNKQGDPIVGTNIISGGPSGKFIGSYYEIGNDGT